MPEGSFRPDTNRPLDALDEILDALARHASLPPEEARAIPPRAYVSEAFHRLEKERIFAPEWHFIGRADELSRPGQFLTLEIAGEAVFAICGADGEPRAFANICRHRSSRLLRGSGKVQRIVCPYHAWNYDLTGRLRSAPLMGEAFDPAGICLPQLGLEVWGGFVFVSLDSGAPPLGPRLTGLADYFANYRLAEYSSLFRVEEVWETNWKCLVENFTEPYHLFHVHAKTVDPALPTKDCKMVAGGEGYTLFEQYRVPGATFEYDEVMEPVNPALTDHERRKYPIACILPAFVVSVSPERLFWMALQPLGTVQVNVRWGVDAFPGSFPEGEEGEARMAALRASLEAINDEDKGIIAGIRANAGSPFAEAGPLSPFERTIWDFQRYLARRLCDDPDAP